jgi:hypothetical protein
VALKERVRSAVAAGEAPSVIRVTENRFARASVRIALRQLRAADETLPSLSAWLAAHERASPAQSDDDMHHR